MNLDNFLQPLLLCGAIFILAGLLMIIFTPKKINYFYGYRTARSMKNQKNWDFSQLYSSKMLILFGVGYIVLSPLKMLFTLSESQESILAMGIILVSLPFLFLIVEKAIDRKSV